MAETAEQPPVAAVLCPRCGGALAARIVKSAFWSPSGVVVVEDIPAQVCDICVDQFYDDSVSDALRRLAEQGFPADQATSSMVVPVFSLTGRIIERPELPEDVFLE